MTYPTPTAVKLVQDLNLVPMWTDITLVSTEEQIRLQASVTRLVQFFRDAVLEDRLWVHEAINRSAEYLLFQYTFEMATAGRRQHSREHLLNALIAVVMATDNAASATTGTLLAVVCRSSEVIGLQTADLFAEAARLAPDPAVGSQIREFPSLPVSLRSIKRFGIREITTVEGSKYCRVFECPPPFSRLWWERIWNSLRGRKRPTRQEVIQIMRDLDQYHEQDEKRTRD